MTIKNQKMEAPLQLTKESFINLVDDNNGTTDKGKSSPVTFTLNQSDLNVLDKQIDRAIRLGKRNKSKSAVIRMALRALNDVADEKYLYLYDKF